MARKALYKHATQVNTNTHPDDGTSPVGSNEWNEAPDPQGMLGFTPATATVTIASGVATVTDTITVVAAESSTSDTLDKLAITNTSQYDLVYLFADTGDTITLTNTSSPSADGHIKTVSDSNETLSSTVPTILIRKGNYWYGYGGGVVNAVNDIGDVIITSVGDNEVLAYDNSSSKWINQTPTEAGFATSATTDTTNASNIGTGTLAAARVATLNQNTTGSSASCTGLSATATLAAQATTVTCTDNAANETVYPTFVDGATGAQDLETDTGLNYNPSTGLLSAVGLTLSGDLTVNGTNTIINSTTLTVDDKNIEMGSVDTPSDTTADGGGITLKGATDKTILWDNANDNFTSSEHVNIASGKSFKVNNTALKDVTETLTNKSIVATQLTGTIADARMPDLTGEVTTVAGAVATTITDNIVDEANLKVDNTPTNDYVLTAKSSASGGLTWAAGGGGDEATPVLQAVGYSAANASPSTEGTHKVSIFAKTIDSNNQGLYVRVKKNGAYVDVQIA